MDELFNAQLLGISMSRYALALGIILFAFIVKKVFAHLLGKLALPLVQRTQGALDDQLLNCVQKPAELIVFLIGLFFALNVLRLPVEPYNLHAFAINLVKALSILAIGWVLFNLVDLVDYYLKSWSSRTESTLDDHLAPLIRKTLRIFIVVMAILMVVQSFGYPVAGLVASLGIGGLAFALAARDTVSNIFGSLMIIFDRPFQIGDWIQAGDMEGTVEEIGFRSTKIRTFAKTLISVPNNVIANMALNNYSRMPKRRIKLTVGVTYDTRPDQMREAVARIRKMLKGHPAIDQEFFLVNFTDFGTSSLDIMVYCFTTTTVWGDYLCAREDVCLQIMDIIADLGLEIAYPSRTVYLHQEDSPDKPQAQMTNPACS
ncbi:MAG: mechanosensitive ion channel family protein [Deltaproteobacteria bacterium]|jgi:MscS family membrane protein|nr:mechanosensitive ion channel family protein [Deltaproteobacteria bacterium]MBW2503766.1 mechanosensitive ion channel family protein [Deltaproteobacteria bacterium]